MSTEYGTFDLEGDFSGNKNNSDSLNLQSKEDMMVHRPWAKKTSINNSASNSPKSNTDWSNDNDEYWGKEKMMQPSISYQSTVTPGDSFSSPPTSIGSSIYNFEVDTHSNDGNSNNTNCLPQQQSQFSNKSPPQNLDILQEINWGGFGRGMNHHQNFMNHHPLPRLNSSLVLHQEAAPYPTCTTPLSSPKHPLGSYREKLETYLDEYWRSGDYKEFVEQLLSLESDSFEDILASRVFRRSLDHIQPAHWHGKSNASGVGGNGKGEQVLNNNNNNPHNNNSINNNWNNVNNKLCGAKSNNNYLENSVLFMKDGKEESAAGLLSLPNVMKMLFVDQTNRHRLLLKLVRDGVIGQASLMRSVYGHLVNIADLELDVPHASLEILALLEQMVLCGLLEPTVFCRIPEDVLTRALEIRKNLKKLSEKMSNEESDDDIADGVKSKSYGAHTKYSPPSRSNNNNNKNNKKFFPSTPQPQKLYAAVQQYRPHEDTLSEMKLAKRVHRNLLIDFFASGNYAKIEDGIVDLNSSNFNHELVEAAVNMSMDYTDVEQRMVAPLLHRLTKRCLIQDEDVQHGIAQVIGRVDDLMLDVPFVKEHLVQLVSSCVIEECVSAELVKREQQLSYGGLSGVEVLSRVLRNTPEYSRKIWGGTGDLRFLEEEMDLAIKEYFDSRDMEEVAAILGELHLSKDLEISFIYTLLLFSIERQKIQVGLNLVDFLKDVYWSCADVESAIDKIREMEQDVALDYPMIQESLRDLVKRAEEQGLVSSEFQIADGQHAV